MKKVIINGIEHVPINSLKNTKKQIIKKNIHFELYPKDAPKKMTWYEAMEYCKTLGENWRLPTISEMFYIYENKFITKNFTYWSNSEYDSNYAWYFTFNYGYMYNGNKLGINHVRVIKDL